MEKTVEFTREELFDKVWAQPLSQIAKEIGISDVALGKACRRARIPLPGRGHWAKGPRHRKTATLPKLRDSYYERVTFNVRKVSGARVSPLKPGATEEIVLVPDELDSPHPLVHKTLTQSRSRASSDGLLTLDRKQALDLRVSAETLDRALRITDALIKASEARGHQWKITAEGKTVVTCDGEQLAVHISERITRREIPRAPAAATRRRRYGEPDFSALTSTRYEWIPSNALSFHVDEYLQSVQRNWNDTRRSSPEQRLHEILGTFPGLAAEVRAQRERREERERLYRLEEERRLARVRVGRGLYALPDRQVTEHAALAEVARKYPQGVVCLLSALRFHDLTSQSPFEVWLGIPNKARVPRIDYPPLRIIRLSGHGLDAGIEEHSIGGVRVQVTSVARTVIDCFKFRNKIGLDVALEVLREAWTEKRVSIDELWRFAKTFRVANVMQPYLESLT